MRGAVKLWTFTEDPFAVKEYGPLTTKDGARQFEVTHVREAKDHLVATLKGIATREDAERLNGIELYIAREKLPETDEDEYYHADLIGLAAVTPDGTPLGTVLAGLLFGALNAGGLQMQLITQTPLTLTTVLQAVIVLFVAAPALVRSIFRFLPKERGSAAVLAKGWNG